jgi:hypothetical protein
VRQQARQARQARQALIVRQTGQVCASQVRQNRPQQISVLVNLTSIIINQIQNLNHSRLTERC